jgi:hypothetical protein
MQLGGYASITVFKTFFFLGGLWYLGSNFKALRGAPDLTCRRRNKLRTWTRTHLKKSFRNPGTYFLSGS